MEARTSFPLRGNPSMRRFWARTEHAQARVFRWHRCGRPRSVVVAVAPCRIGTRSAPPYRSGTSACSHRRVNCGRKSRRNPSPSSTPTRMNACVLHWNARCPRGPQLQHPYASAPHPSRSRLARNCRWFRLRTASEMPRHLKTSWFEAKHGSRPIERTAISRPRPSSKHELTGCGSKARGGRRRGLGVRNSPGSVDPDV
jgi:hypothetical protein